MYHRTFSLWHADTKEILRKDDDTASPPSHCPSGSVADPIHLRFIRGKLRIPRQVFRTMYVGFCALYCIRGSRKLLTIFSNAKYFSALIIILLFFWHILTEPLLCWPKEKYLVGITQFLQEAKMMPEQKFCRIVELNFVQCH